MAVIEELLRARLIADATVGGLVGQRVYPVVAPAKATLPAITYQRISGMRVQSHDGPTGLARPRFQFACMAKTYSGAKTLANAVRRCLDGYGGTTDGVRAFVILLQMEMDVYSYEDDEAASSFTVLVDFVVWHSET